MNKQGVLSIVLFLGLATVTAYGAADAPKDQSPADVKKLAAQVAVSSKSQQSLPQVAARVADAIQAMPRELCAMISAYTPARPVIVKNFLPKTERWIGDDLLCMDRVTVRFAGVEKVLNSGEQFDFASALETWEIIPAVRGPYEPYQKVFISYMDPRGRGIVAEELTRVSAAKLWEGIGFYVVQDKNKKINSEEFDPEKNQGPSAQPAKIEVLDSDDDSF